MGKAGGKSGKFSDKTGKVSGDARERLVAFLRAVHPHKTADHVAADVHLSADTVRKWLDGSASPSCIALLRLISVYGPPLLAAVMDCQPGWLDVAHRAVEVQRLEQEQAVLAMRLARMRGQA